MGDQNEVLIDIRERLVRIETKQDAQSDIRGKVEELEAKVADIEPRGKSNTYRLNQLEANLTWLWRTVVGALIAAGVSAFVAFK